MQQEFFVLLSFGYVFFFCIYILVAERDAPSPVGYRNKTKRQGYKGIDIL
jgi:hypothetical protein